LPTNAQILLDNRPTAEATLGNFKLVTHDTPSLQDGQVLVRHHYLSLDPYMRGRMMLPRATPHHNPWAK
jgi:NADPH-dependent curcumin reductase CurA